MATQQHKTTFARWTRAAAVIALCVLTNRPVQASRIVELTRLGGDQTNELVGIGLVVGLNHTGDGGDFQPAMRPLQAMLSRFGDGGSLAKDLKSANDVAIVMVSVSVPAAGGHAGDKLDVKVSAIAAKSLRGGRLVVCPLLGPHPEDRRIYGLANGDITLDDDLLPTQGTIRSGAKGGATLQEDIAMDNTSDGKFTLALLPSAASFANATAIADQINEDVTPQTDGKPAATAVDANTVIVQIPKAELAKPAQFIARVQQLQVPALPQTGRIEIDSKKQTIVITGDVEVAPALISQGGVTITVSAPASTPAAGARTLDSGARGGPKLNNLMDSFNLLKVTPEDRITIIKKLHESGALRCQLDID